MHKLNPDESEVSQSHFLKFLEESKAYVLTNKIKPKV